MRFQIVLFSLFLSVLAQLNAQNAYTQYVNPFVGTGGHGHTFPGSTLPYALVQLSPDTRIDGSWDGCSGYHYSDSIIYGFSHTHLSGTGVSDYGDISFMPTIVSKPVEPIQKIDTLCYSFSHNNEKSKPGYYSVLLDNGIQVELSSTTRVGIQKYTYSRKGFAWVTLNLKHRDQLLQGKIIQNSNKSFSGFRRSKAWAEDQLLYYYFELSRDAESIIISKDSSGETKVNLGFWVKKGEHILIKTALSSVDEEGAESNLKAEMPHWDFEKVRKDADLAWNIELNRIQVYGGTLIQKQNFYTALYHCMIHPNVMNDVDGRYRGRDKMVHTADGFNYYTVFSLWDTYRALHPLLNVIDKKRSHDFIMTFKAQYEQSGRLPMWELWGNETNCMIGFHSVSVILDSYKNGVISLEELADLYPAVRAEAMSNRFGLDKFREKGFLSIDDESESVSKTIEYSYDMWCISQIARQILNSKLKVRFPDLYKDASLFEGYSSSWINLYNQKSGFMTPRLNGNWIQNFDPKQVNNHFTEANAWQYRFGVQQSSGLIANDDKISKLFNTDSKTTGREQSDISGLIGQYAHGNEPSHHVAYLFKSQDSTIKYTSKICAEMYAPEPDGLIGNEDCGQMSAWYVFSAMGLYPDCPGSDRYVKSKSLFDSVLVDGKTIQETFFNRRVFDFSDAISIVPGRKVSAPINSYKSTVFKDSVLVSILSNTNYNDVNSKIKYQINLGKFKHYLKPFWIHENSIVKASIQDTNYSFLSFYSDVAVAQLFKRPNSYSIQIKSVYNSQYTAGGDDGLLDGLIGDDDWRKGRWQGYQGQDFEAVIDRKEKMNLDSIQIGFIDDKRSWIFLPSQVIVFGSSDSSSFIEINQLSLNQTDNSGSRRLNVSIQGNRESYRYIKVIAKNFGKLPDNHPGAGGDAFIFIDELTFH
ncbi:MAG: GH92 family glycosyl hydrolase [Bacteroidia bacterium]